MLGIFVMVALGPHIEPALATVIPSFTLPGLVTRADIVAVATVTDLKASRSGPHHFIYTDYTLQTEAIWLARGSARKLKAGEPMLLRQIGGVLADAEQTVVGTADLRRGDRIVIIARFIDGRAYLVGMGQGARYVSDSSVRVSRPGRAHPTRKAPAPTLEQFRQRVRSVLEEAGQ